MRNTLMTTKEVTQYLMDANVIKSKSIQSGKNVLLRWCKDGIIKSIPGENRRQGLKFEKEEVDRFILSRSEGNVISQTN